MDKAAVAKAAVTKAAKAIKKAVERDRDHFVLIKEDAVVGTFDKTVFGMAVPDYRCDNFEIRDRVLTVFATGGREPVCDGATLAPDKCVIDIAPGYIPHDLGYAEIDAMAADPAWREAGWTEATVRALWDMVLGQCLLAEAGRSTGFAKRKAGSWIARIYYAFVRRFGGIAHGVMRVVGFITLSFVIAGCSVPAGFTPSPDSIEYEVVPRANFASN